MKKIVAIMILSASAFAAQASYLLNYSLFDFFDKGGDMLSDKGVAAIVTGLSGVDFSSFTLNAGDVINVGDWYNSASGTGVYILDLVNIDNESMATGNPVVPFETLQTLGFVGGEEIAVIALTQADEEILAGSITVDSDGYYTVFTPSMNGGDCGDPNSDAWNLITGGVGINIGMITENEGGTLPNSYATLSTAVAAVPEPATFAAIFGAIALALAIRRRK